jgi:hypothetical protein
MGRPYAFPYHVPLDAFSMHRRLRENGTFEPFVYENAIILPRQARDKHRENSKNKDAVFRTCSSAERRASAVVAARTCPRSRLVSVKNG